ncbi:hypothetical protein NDN13_05315 [Acinetobacter sp. C32I]|uniref:DUF6988 family protein n=1 Tax=Acinetobacter sp. C32I TaxID=2950074 RepID=UPI0020366717|nr:hypothetical protein [Acinetobacter sp. C32I]USA54613.1 hypothetical protein NDN13_05315 [Acinetobacter sp. C32I]
MDIVKIKEPKHIFDLSLAMLSELEREISKSHFMDIGVRLDLAKQSIFISYEHAKGINKLLNNDLPIPAMVLFRVQFEAVLRAFWIMFVAEGDKITSLSFGYTMEEQFEKEKYPTATDMINLLDAANLPARDVVEHFKMFKKYHLKQLNSFVHTGKQSFTRDLLGFDIEILMDVLRQSNNLVTIAAQLLFTMTLPDKQKYIGNLIQKYRHCFYMDQDVNDEKRQRVDSYFEGK